MFITVRLAFETKISQRFFKSQPFKNYLGVTPSLEKYLVHIVTVLRISIIVKPWKQFEVKISAETAQHQRLGSLSHTSTLPVTTGLILRLQLSPCCNPRFDWVQPCFTATHQCALCKLEDFHNQWHLSLLPFGYKRCTRPGPVRFGVTPGCIPRGCRRMRHICIPP